MTRPTTLQSSIGQVTLDSYVMNASGPRCSSAEELHLIGRSNAAAIVTKSCTILPREGNAEPRYRDLELGAIQSMGLPNLGYNAYLDLVPELLEHNKPVVVSISGLSLADNETMVKAFDGSDASLLEVNFSCPNIAGKPQTAYDFEQVENSLTRLCSLTDKPLGIKLAPYFDMSHFDSMAEILNRFPIAFISTINSIGNTLIIDPQTERAVIKPKGGFGGLCGQYVKPIGLANVHAFRQRLRDDIDIVGVGGIYNGTDAFEYALAGASAVQVATSFQQQGEGCFQRINDELAALLEAKGYASIKEVIGQLKAF
ncbi:dihydroorotate dehydrogenase (fumarate) [Sinobacterium caligoides]|uniref:dihydroorotate oxidase (fumarate) n=1 Tax=Sinobacterium caligoides TaxID=933926 RepID=A0A3N2DNP6_9GAMM|nr:dihydroorotate oxidase [Sinobacterium caligoides]ROS01427.1 dihydroorotate dehydrogenase (fumarate) [Sinobacterium caligoides]